MIAAGGKACVTNQILYNLTRRGPELDLLPWLDRRGLPAMAYSPVEQGRLVAHPGLVAMAHVRGVSAAQLALAWLLARDGILAIPKAGTIAHVRDNHAAAELRLDPDDLAALDRLFPRPGQPVPLEML